jgi:2,3-bisphosphoglycerate-dependent phosphoglycerate mutase
MGMFSWPEAKLTATGRHQAKLVGETLKNLGLEFDFAFTSGWIRAQESLDIVLEVLDHKSIPLVKAPALNTRSYGSLGGRLKKDVRKEYGDQQVRYWDSTKFSNFPDNRPPEGETLIECDERAKAYYNKQIKPKALAGKNILVLIHENPVLCVTIPPTSSTIMPCLSNWSYCFQLLAH